MTILDYYRRRNRILFWKNVGVWILLIVVGIGAAAVVDERVGGLISAVINWGKLP